MAVVFHGKYVPRNATVSSNILLNLDKIPSKGFKVNQGKICSMAIDLYRSKEPASSV